MLYEGDVIDAVCVELESRGYQIRQRLLTTQRGDDIIAVKAGPTPIEIYIEAKGETSSRTNSYRYGKPFDSAAVKVHVAEALYKAVEVLSRTHQSNTLMAGIALPDNAEHRNLAKRIEPILKQLEIVVFWVNEQKKVRIDSMRSL